MSHTTHVQDDDGNEWYVIHNSDRSGYASIRSHDGRVNFTLPAAVIKRLARVEGAFSEFKDD